MYYELVAGVGENYTTFLDAVIVEMNENETTALQIPQQEHDAFVEKAGATLQPIITMLTDQMGEALAREKGPYGEKSQHFAKLLQ